MNLKRTPIALAVSALLAAPLALIPGIASGVDVDAKVEIDQESHDNVPKDTGSNHNSRVTDSVGRNSTGNNGYNIGAGDFNLQSNSASLATAVADAGFVFEGADADVDLHQDSGDNKVTNTGGNNRAVIGSADDEPGGGAFSHHSGNLGVNMASGHLNLQNNSLAIATSPRGTSEARVEIDQHSHDNKSTTTGGGAATVETTVPVTFTIEPGGLTGSYNGNASGNNYHPGSTDVEHDYVGTESGTVALEGTFSGEVPVVTQTTNGQVNNNAVLRGNALVGISGKSGVNVAAGNGNLQTNSLSIATTTTAQ